MAKRATGSDTKEIFIVHGHDETAKLSVANHLYSLGLRPIVLHEEPNLGQAIIEKFETHAATAGYAVVIMSPDDLGRPHGGTEAPRARQNVVLELGYFTGKLGRDRVFLLISGQVEMPSDILGVGHTVMDPNGAWKLDLNKELHALGYTVT